MNKLLTLVSILTTLTFISCGQPDPNKQIDEGTVKDNTYTSEEIGWTIKIPDGWTVINQEQTQANNERGLNALEETLENEIDLSGLKNLIGFQKNQFNIFQSSSEPFELEYDGEWEENNAALKEVIYTTYLNQGMRADSSATTTEEIDGLEFQRFSFTIYSPKGEVIMKQTMYSRLINGFDFGVNLNYNNDEDKEIMLEAWKNSTFKKQHG
ncbi:hypothetical protein [Croceimicrobium hydrocarbonivorans]|uniref:Lipoprotein n=1 Tax=Croceimicrobium hydrocarbonivorans TaxID=2761580 RepID=A0A7H0VHD0_9FLAO|nr:hypothetical protein [Croceimicrobium hydrocarbonivorans]QNR25128.1 hypothetical protein H4K34_04630 [Croceimicrobium hydrocarbonivorans]